MSDLSVRTSRQDGDRGVVPMVGKALEAAIVVLFIGVMTTALYGGIVPEYRGAAAGEVGERTIVAAGSGVERSIPPEAREVRSETVVDLPTTIHNSNYRIEVRERTLHLDHPHPDVNGQIPLLLPDRVVNVEGSWQSGARTIVVVESASGEERAGQIAVRLENR